MKKINIDLAFARVNGRIQRQINARAEQALRDLDDLCDLMKIRADYEWLKSQVTPAFPLGISNWVDVQIVKRAAKAAGLDHIADALIEELSLQGLGIDLGDLDRARA